MRTSAQSWVKIALTVATLAIANGNAQAQTLRYVTDLPSTSPQPLFFKRLAACNGTLFFVCGDASTGLELWKTDGTAGGTVMVKDIAPGPASSSISEMTAWRSHVYFAANDGMNGEELWRTDGTANGTVMVKDIAPGAPSSKPRVLTAAVGKLYFELSGSTNPFALRELWSTDGTASGTVAVTTFPGSRQSSVELGTSWSTLGDQLVFDIGNAWGSDSTAAGTALLTPAHASQTADNFLRIGDRVFYLGFASLSAADVWRTDGTAAGTELVRRFRFEQTNPRPFVGRADGRVLLGARSDSDMDVSASVWMTDGTPQGTSLLKEISAGPESIPTMLGSVGSQTFFLASDGVHGTEPWVTDGTSQGTIMLADFTPGAGSQTPQFALLRDRAFLLFKNPLQLMMSDGTPAGTSPIATPPEFPPSSTSSILMAPAGSSLFFFVSDPTAPQLWILETCPADADNSGTLEINDIFVFLNAWFAGGARGDFDHNGTVTIDDIFQFLNAWFTGCP